MTSQEKTAEIEQEIESIKQAYGEGGMTSVENGAIWLLARVKELEVGLKLAISVADDHIHSEYDGTSYLEDLLAELNPARKALEGSNEQA